MSQVSTRVRGINALLTVVDFAAGAIGSAEGELAQKDAVIRQLTEQLARCDSEQKANEERARQEFELVERTNAEMDRKIADVRKIVSGLLTARDRLADDRGVSFLDADLNLLRAVFD